MDNRNNGYSPLLLLLGQLMKGIGADGASLQNPPAQETWQSGENRGQGDVYFRSDETESSWRREEKLELLVDFCREGFAMARKHGHFLIGSGPAGTFLAIPGRFLLSEQPAGGVTGFTLWQPLAGGEELYDSLEELSGTEAEEVYGYWIARMDPETLKLSEF